MSIDKTPDSGGHQRGHCGLYGRRGGLPDGGGGFAAAAPGPPLNLWALAGRHRGHAAQALDAAAEFEVMQLSAISGQLSAQG